MKKKKITVGILFGGKSAEHEVSLQSARNVAEAIDTQKYNVVLIGIDKSGKWHLQPDAANFLLHVHDPKLIALNKQEAVGVSLLPQHQGELSIAGSVPGGTKIDVVFPILHGPFGEDGTVQGLLKLAGVPFVGAGVLGSAVGMDKDIMKRLLRDAGLPIGKFLVVQAGEKVSFTKVVAALGLPFYVKPANMGSSVGVSKVTKQSQFSAALAEAFLFDRKILLEENIKGREIECAVLGNDTPLASTVGEIILHDEFYSYTAKYIDEHGATLAIPATLPKATIKAVQKLAIATFKTLVGNGLGRVDFFLKENGELIINEINTMPGFTSVSMYPKLWEASGISYPDLIDKLIQLALDKFAAEQSLKTGYDII
jgi:D-alanine-D-alanine ligase